MTISEFKNSNFRLNFDAVVIHLADEEIEVVSQELRNIWQILNTYNSNILLISKNPFSTISKNKTPLKIFRNLIQKAGFYIIKQKLSKHNVISSNLIESEFLVTQLGLIKNPDLEVSLVIKASFQDIDFLETQINHIIYQTEAPRNFTERIIVVDSKESKFLRQYSSPNREKTISILEKLKKKAIIDNYYLSPNNYNEIMKINKRWFNVEVEKSHSIRNIPVTPQIYGFELAKGRYLLQVDIDIIIGRRDFKHDYLLDMINCLDNDRSILSVGFNICHDPSSDFVNFFSSEDGFVPEVRICLFNKDRLLNNRPYPNKNINGKLELTWYRSLELFQRETTYISVRGGSPNTFFIHPQNDIKRDKELLFEIIDKVEQNLIPEIQYKHVDLKDNIKEWRGKSCRKEEFVFVICGRNLTPEKFERCWTSVISQKNDNWGAIIVDDNSSTSFTEYVLFTTREHHEKITIIRNKTHKGILNNIYNSIKEYCINPYSIIITLDADDSLISNYIIDSLYEKYIQGIQLTIGNSLRKQKGILPFEPKFDQPRTKNGGDVWMHLRTFRKYLFDSIDKLDLLDNNNEWLDKFNELSFMIPMVEMASKTFHNKWPVYYYDPSHIRNKDHYIKNQETIDLLFERKIYTKKEIVIDFPLKPMGEIVNYINLIDRGSIIVIQEIKDTSSKFIENKGSTDELSNYGKYICELIGNSINNKIDIIATSSSNMAKSMAYSLNKGLGQDVNIISLEILNGYKIINEIEWNKFISRSSYDVLIDKWMKSDILDNYITSYEKIISLLIQSLKIYNQYKNKIIYITSSPIISALIYYFEEILITKIPDLHGYIVPNNTNI